MSRFFTVRLLVGLWVASQTSNSINGLQPLMGGSISWKIDPGFMQGKRQVTFRMSTAFIGSPDCQYSTDQLVSCQPGSYPGCYGSPEECSAADKHGVLCVAQLLGLSSDNRQPNYWVSGSQCVHDLNLADASYAIGSPPTAEMVGRSNIFNVTGTKEFGPQATAVVFGDIVHTVTVAPEASGVFAWIAPREGFANLDTANGLLLPQCPDAGPCAVNVEDSGSDTFGLRRSICSAGGCTARSPGTFSPSDSYWANFTFSSGTQSRSLPAAASPALETLVSLCFNSSTSPMDQLHTLLNTCNSTQVEDGLCNQTTLSYSCSNRPISNFHSPVASIPHVFEVPVTPRHRQTILTADSSFQGSAVLPGNPPSQYYAPHREFHFKSFDLDGDMMTQYLPYAADTDINPIAKLGQSLRAECYVRRIHTTQDAWWPGRQCLSGSKHGMPCSNDECGEQSQCATSWSGCRQFSDLDTGVYDNAGNLLKFDFAFGGTLSPFTDPLSHPEFSQHVRMTIDMPGLETLADGTTWWSGSASVQTLFSSIPCDSGTENQPPVFVSSPGSSNQDVLSEFSCYYGKRCDIALHARDFDMAVDGSISGSETSDKITIEPMSMGHALPASTLQNINGTDCIGSGSLSCKFTLSSQELTHVVGQSMIRCFITRDLHHASSAPLKLGCPSLPYCLKIHVVELPSFGGTLLDLGLPKASLKPLPSPQDFQVLLQWDKVELSDMSLEQYRIQFLRDDASTAESITDVSLDKHASNFSIDPSWFHDRSTSSAYKFRLLIETERWNYFSLWSNWITLFENDLTEWSSGNWFIASWRGQGLYWSDLVENGDIKQLGSQLSRPVMQRSLVYDGSLNRVLGLIAMPGDEPDPAIQFVHIDPDSGIVVTRENTAVQGVTVWNVEFDEMSNSLVFMGVQESRVDIFSLHTSTLQLNSLAVLSTPVRFGASSFDRTNRKYFFVDADSGGMRYLDLASSVVSPVHPFFDEGAKLQILALGYDHIRLQLYAWVGKFPLIGTEAVSLVQHDMNLGIVAMQSTSILANAIEYGTYGFDFFSQKALIATSNGTILEHDISANSTSTRWPMAPAEITFIASRNGWGATVHGLSPRDAVTDGSAVATLTGSYFGMRDFSPLLSLELLSCSSSEWVSDREILCRVPQLIHAKAGLEAQIRLQVGVSDRTYPQAISLSESWTALSPSAKFALPLENALQVYGNGFQEPYAAYKIVMYSSDWIFVGRPPISSSDSQLVFDLPVLCDTADTSKVLLLHDIAENLDSLQSPVRGVHSEIEFTFSEVWSIVHPTTMLAEGQATITISGLGFNVSDSDAYSLQFGTGMIVPQVTVHSYREITALIPESTFAASLTSISVLKHGAVLQRFTTLDALSIQSAEFEFLEQWIDLSITSGPASGGSTLYVSGHGFDVNSSYSCTFQGIYNNVSITVDAVPLNYSSVRCVTASTIGLNMTSSLVYLSKGQLQVDKRPPPATFDFIPFWDNAPSVTQGSAAGGTQIRFYGGGITAGAPVFRCVFNDTYTVAAAIYVTNSSEYVECTLPTWSGPAGLITVRIVRQGSSANSALDLFLSQLPTPSYQFLIFAEVITIQPRAAIAGEEVSIRIIGAGFDPCCSFYVCRLETQVVGNASMQDVRQTTAVHAVNSTHIECPVINWDLSAGTAHLILLREDQAVFGSHTVDFVQDYASLIPRKVLASGEVQLTIFGAGFSDDPGDYQCNIFIGPNSEVSSVDSVSNASVIVCRMPVWLYPAGLATVDVVYRGQTLERPLQASLQILALITRLEPTRGSAFGGDVIIIDGYGFDTQFTYQCQFDVDSTTGTLYLNATVLNATQIQCTTPQWLLPARQVVVKVSQGNETLSGSSVFEFTEAVGSMLGAASALSAIPVTVTLDGRGFVPSKSYQCKFRLLVAYTSFANSTIALSNRSDSICVQTAQPSLFESSSVFGELSRQTNATVVNSTRLECLSPVWPFAAGTAEVSVLLSERKLPSNEIILFTLEDHIIDSYPGSGPSEKASITIVGAGFDTTRIPKTYECVISQNGLSFPARAQCDSEDSNQQILVCSLSWPEQAVLVDIRVRDTATGTFSDGSVNFFFEENITGVLPTISPASGNTVMNISGFGLSPNFTYFAHFQVGQEILATSSPSVFLSPQLIQVKVPPWPSDSGVIVVSFSSNDGAVVYSQTFNFEFTEIISTSYPDHGLVFGSYLTVQGFGFIAGEQTYQAFLSSIDEAIVLETPLAAPGINSKTIEFIVPRLDGHERAFTFKVFHNGEQVPVIPGSELTYFIRSAWMTATLPTTTNFLGGEQIVVHGNGFDTSSSINYTCVFRDSTQGACGGLFQDACFFSNSSDYTVPERWRGPAQAKAEDRIECYIPTWLHQNSHAVFQLYADEMQVEKVFSGALFTTFTGGPKLETGANAAKGGGVLVNLTGTDFGLVDLSPDARVGEIGTSCEFTKWSSSTYVICLVPRKRGGQLTLGLEVTIGPYHIAFLSESFTYNGAAVAAAYRPDDVNRTRFPDFPAAIGNTGAASSPVAEYLRIEGREFQKVDLTPTARLGDTGVEVTLWLSDSSMLAKAASGIGRTGSAIVTIEFDKATISEIFSFDLPVMSSPGIGNTPTFSNFSSPIILFGAGFGLNSITHEGRLDGTAAEITVWKADSAVSCLWASGVEPVTRAVLTAGAVAAASQTEALSYDLAPMTNSRNAPPTGSAFFMISGVGFVSSASQEARIGHTSEETSVWISETSLHSLGPQGIGTSKGIVLTVVNQEITASYVFTYDAPENLVLHSKIDQGYRITGFPFAAYGVGTFLSNLCSSYSGGEQCVEFPDFEPTDHSTSLIFSPSSWGFCKDDSNCIGGNPVLCKCKAFESFESSEPAYETIIHQGSGIFAAGTLDTTETEGTNLMMKPGPWSVWTDFTIEVQLVDMTAQSWIGVSFRYQDEDNYYRFEMRLNVEGSVPAVPQVWRLKRKVAGNVQVLWSCPTDPGCRSYALLASKTMHTLRIENIDDIVSVFLDQGTTANPDRDHWTLLYDPRNYTASPRSGSFGLFSAGSSDSYFVNFNIFMPFSLAKHSNSAPRGNQSMTITGHAFGASSATTTAQMHLTATAQTDWVGDSSLICRAVRGILGTRSIQVTSDFQIGTKSEAHSFDAPQVSTYFNLATTASISLTLTAMNLFSAQPSLAMKKGATGCEASEWVADTSLRCFVAIGHASTRTIKATIGAHTGSDKEMSSYDMLKLSHTQLRNAPGTGSTSVTVRGAQLGLHDYCVSTRLSFTACESSLWHSDTMVTALLSHQALSTAVVKVTSGVRADSFTEQTSFDVPQIHFRANSSGMVESWANITATLYNKASTGSVSITVIGSGLGAHWLSGVLRASDSAAETTEWISETTVAGLLSGGTTTGVRIRLTLAGRSSSSFTDVVTYNNVHLTGGMLNSPTTGSSVLSIHGSNLGHSHLSSSRNAGGTSCETSDWISSTSVVGLSASSGLIGSLRLTLTMGFRDVASLTEAVSYHGFISSSQDSNHPSTGAVSLSLIGSGMGHSTMSARVGISTCEASTWISDSVLSCRSHGLQISMRLQITSTFKIAGTASSLASYDTVSLISTSLLANRERMEFHTLTAIGSSFGTYDRSGGSLVGPSVAELTDWVSDTALNCHISNRVLSSLALSLTVGMRGASVTDMISFDRIIVSSAAPANIPRDGTPLLFIGSHSGMLRSANMSETLAGFSHSLFSSAIRVSTTAAESTSWVSDSTVRCGASVSDGRSAALVLTSSLRVGPSLSEVVSYLSPEASSVISSNAPATGSVFVRILGVSSGRFSGSSMLRSGSSACESSLWDADTQVRCLASVQTWQSSRLLITGGIASLGSLSEALSYDLLLSTVFRQNGPGTGASLAILTGLGFGTTSSTVSASLFTGCEHSSWEAATSVVCLSAAGGARYDINGTLLNSRRVSLTAGAKTGSISEVWTVDNFFVSHVSRQNRAPISNQSISVMGMAFGQSWFTGLGGRLAGTASEDTIWVSDTTMVCRPLTGVAASRHFVLSSARIFVSALEVFSYDVTGSQFSAGANLTGNIPVSTTHWTVVDFLTNTPFQTAATRIGMSGCEASEWFSESSLMCLTTARSTAGSDRIALTIGSRALSQTEVVSFDLEVVTGIRGNNQSSNELQHPSRYVRITGLGYDHGILSWGGRAGASGCESTSWQNDTSLLCRDTRSTGPSHRLVVTSAVRTSSLTEVLSYSQFSQWVVQQTFNSSDVSMVIGSYGHRFGTAAGSFGSTSCESSSWSSDTSLICMTGMPRSANSRSVAVTLGSQVASVSEALSFDVGTTSSLGGSNIMSTSMRQLFLNGHGYARIDMTAAVRAGSTGCEGSAWISHSSIKCFASSGSASTLRLVVTSTASTSSSVSQVLSYGISAFQTSYSNTEPEGGDHIVLTMANYSTFPSTVAIRLASTGCEASIWNSETSVSCKASAALGPGLRLIITGNSMMGSLTDVISSDQVLVSQSRQMNLMLEGKVSLTMFGREFGTDTYSVAPVGRLLSSATESTEWISMTAVSCVTSLMSSIGSARLVLTVEGHLGTLTDTLSIDTFAVSRLMASNARGLRSNSSLTVFGRGLGRNDISVLSTVGMTSSEVSAWVSDSVLLTRASSFTSEGSTRMLVTASSRVGSMSEAMTYDGTSILLSYGNQSSNIGLNVRRVELTTDAFGKGQVASLSSRIGSTSCEASHWNSGTSVVCFAAVGNLQSRQTIVTASSASVSRTETLSYDLVEMNTTFGIAASRNSLVDGGDFVTIRIFGSAAHTTGTAAARIGLTACEATTWASVTSISCISPAAVGVLEKMGITLGSRVGTVTNAFSTDQLQVSSISPSNVFKSLSLLTVLGVDLGQFWQSPVSAGRLSGTGLDSSNWYSETSISCHFTVSGSIGTMRLVMTIEQSHSSISEAVSYDRIQMFSTYYSLTNVSNSKVTNGENNVLLISGKGLGGGESSLGSRVGSSGCESSEWASESEMTCMRLYMGVGGTERVVLTISTQSGSLTEALSFDTSSVLVAGNQSMNAMGGMGHPLTVRGIGFSRGETSLAARVGMSSCESSEWVSESEVSCMRAYAGPGGSERLVLTTGVKSASSSSGISFDAATVVQYLSSMVPTNRSLLHVTLTLRESTLASSVGLTACEGTEWTSVTSLSCLAPYMASGGSSRVTLTAGARAGTLSEAVSYGSAVLTDLRGGNVAVRGRLHTTIAGHAIGRAQTTFDVRVGQTSCEGTQWSSDTALVCVVASGRGTIAKVAATAGNKVYSANDMGQYDLLQAVNLTTTSGSQQDWASSVLPLRWAGPPEGGNNLTISGRNFGVQDYTMQVLIGDTECSASQWVADSSVICKVPAVGWQHSSCDTVQCRVDYPVTIQQGNESAISASAYVYNCPCTSSECFDHNYTSAAGLGVCQNVNECDAVECDGTVCPKHNCNGSATCIDTVGSFICSCDGLFGKVVVESEGFQICDFCQNRTFKHSSLSTECNNVSVTSVQRVVTGVGLVDPKSLSVSGNSVVLCEPAHSVVKLVDLSSNIAEIVFDNNTNLTVHVLEPIDIALHDPNRGVLVDNQRNVLVDFFITEKTGQTIDLAPHSRPCAVDVTQTGSKAVVGFRTSTQGGSSNVVLIDLPLGNMTVIGTNHSFTDPCSVSFGFDEEAVLVLDRASSQILSINLTTDEVLEVKSTGADSIAGSPDSEHIIVQHIQDATSGDGHLSVVHMDSGLEFVLESGMVVDASDVVDGANQMLVFDRHSGQFIDLGWSVHCAPGSSYSTGFICH